ncbi:SMC family ATPase [Sphingobacterium sp. DR205]|uniref:AAA family ATPase n=1 Tax=Sphingobacterium sp. DR205 TaxID=2713573 RepID=UPI0013E411E4|nr:SMC family ATPase [Sphingobacterium sp. DR205]QIH33633.1 SMC family ATPase [Sphingobacterium sp. DR205]
MIPLKLIVEGIYSYQERQTIDFSALTETGLFGIFGAVGSGKSSILEAITYALYGETERLNARDKRAYNMMNLKSNRSYIELDFINFENRRFRATREFKRNSKNFEDVKSPTVVLYENINEEWIPLESSNVQPIIGLSYENFKRTIIIPQGQFKEFIELGAKERTDMMKEIFQLHRFDLQDKVATLYKKNQSELDQLNGQLIGFEEINGDRIQAMQDKLLEERKSFIQVQDSNTILLEKFQALKNLKEDFLELHKMKTRFQQLTNQRAEKEHLRQRMIRFEEAWTNFYHILQAQEKLRQEQVHEQGRLQHEETKANEIQKLTQQLSLQLQQIRPQYDRLAERRISELDLELILQLIQFSAEIKVLKESAEKGRNFVLETKEQQTQCKISIRDTEALLLDLKQSRPSANELMELGQWYTQQQSILQREVELHQQLLELETAIADLKNNLLSCGFDALEFESKYNSELRTLESRLTKLNDEKAHLLLQQKLTQFAENLSAGSPCPLCGALEHPAIAEHMDISQELADNQKAITEITANIKSRTDQKFEFEKLLLRLQSLEAQKNDLNVKSQVNESLKSSHLLQFTWTDYSSTDASIYTQKKQELTKIETQIVATEHMLTNHQLVLVDIEKKLERANKRLNELEVDEVRKQTQINQNMGHLKHLKWSDYQSLEQTSIESEYKTLKAENLQIEQHFNTLTEQLNGLNSQFAAQNSLVQAILERIDKIKAEALQTETTLGQLLQTSTFDTIDQVKETLAENLPVQQIRAELEQFQIQFETLKAQIAQLDEKLTDQVYDEEAFIAQENALKESSHQLKVLTENVAKYEQELHQLETAYKKKEVLLQQQATLNLRNDNLKQLFNLFKGAGFVQYVSSIYLRQLCDHANIRFHRMTRNQLSLQINENNEFEIIDYLNEGKSRSVKTLSGGQAFQVSLSLALALAESVQSNTKATKNFFFIDEGFGTQDIASVNIVFETLLDLQKENRIVGIISHVEELKERIPLSLSIEKDEERGSQIFIN